jgi:hypothetical protein
MSSRRESLQMLVARSIDADTVVQALERLLLGRGAPELLRCDNGPEMTAHALRDWCVLPDTGTASIEPGAPLQNPFVERRLIGHDRLQADVLALELLQPLDVIGLHPAVLVTPTVERLP